jgi:hypothetical protein
MSYDTQSPTWSDVTDVRGNTLPSHSELTIQITQPDGFRCSIYMPADELTIDQVLGYLTVAVKAAGFTYVNGLQTVEEYEEEGLDDV